MLEGGNPVFTTIVYILSTLLFCAVLKFILTGGSVSVSAPVAAIGNLLKSHRVHI